MGLNLHLAGVESDLIVFDGLQHGFFMDPDLPESRIAYDLIARFFRQTSGAESVRVARRVNSISLHPYPPNPILIIEVNEP